jgi:hypothetical protein
MKNYSFLFLMMLGLAIMSCRQQDVDPDGEQNPSITITFPSLEDNFVAERGTTFNVDGVAEDNEGLTSLTYSVQLIDSESEDGQEWYVDNEPVPGFNANAGNDRFDFSIPLEVPNDAQPGVYQISVRADDAKGNWGVVHTQVVVTHEGNGGGQETGTVTFRVIDVPNNTPDNATIFLTGNFEQDVPLQQGQDGVWTVTVEAPVGTTINYLYSRGTEGTEEVNTNGTERTQRSVVVEDGEKDVEDVIERWEDHEELEGENG